MDLSASSSGLPSCDVSTPDLIEFLLAPETGGGVTALEELLGPSAPFGGADAGLDGLLASSPPSILAAYEAQAAEPAFQNTSAGASAETQAQHEHHSASLNSMDNPVPTTATNDMEGSFGVLPKELAPRPLSGTSSIDGMPVAAPVLQAHTSAAMPQPVMYNPMPLDEQTAMPPLALDSAAPVPLLPAPHLLAATFWTEDTTKAPDPGYSHRFRSKSKRQIFELERQLRQVATQLEQLKLENTKLHQKLKICEVVLPFREQQLMSAAGAASSNHTALTSSTSTAGEQPTSTTGQPATEQDAAQQPLMPSATAATSDASAVRASDAPSNNPVISSPSQAAPPDLPAASAGQSPAAIPMMAAAVQQAFAIGMRQEPLTDAEFREVHLHYQKSVAHLVAAWNTFPTAAVAAQLMDLQVELSRQVIVAVYALNRRQYHRHNGVNLETGADDCPGEALWVRVGRQLIPIATTAELSHAKAAVAMYDDLMKDVLAERKVLAEQLSACTDEDSYLAQVLVDKMEANLVKESDAQQTVLNYIGMTALTVPLNASMWAFSYPYFPDHIACIRAATETHGK